MEKLTSLFLALTLGLLIPACATIIPVSAQQDFSAFLGNTIEDTAIDGTIGSEWDDAGNYANVAINPRGTAEVWTKHDGTYFYMAVRFTADTNNPWLALLFGGFTCMQINTDGALFGHDSYAADGYRDISFGGLGVISNDASQEGNGAISVGASNIVTVELKKPLNSGDSIGEDMAWMEDNTYTMIIMWDSNGGGSSGGSASHSGGSATVRTVLINSKVIPEFPGLILAVVLVATAISAILLKKRIITKPMTNVIS
jgi:hypothetical protein